MNSVERLDKLGPSLWLDNITRKKLDDGTAQKYIDAFAVTGVTSSLTTIDGAIGTKSDNAGIRASAKAGLSREALFMELALEDMGRAADLFAPIFYASRGGDGWVSIEISPLLAHDVARSIDAALWIHHHTTRPNVFVKIPGTRAGIRAIEESIFIGIPINATLLFSPEQYVDAAEAYLRGIERRILAGLDPRIGSVASVFISRWDGAVRDRVPAYLQNRLGIAIGARIYRTYRELLASQRWRKLAAAGARPQRLVWATNTKDSKASDTMYAERLAAPDTIDTIPEKTLCAFRGHGRIGRALADDGGDPEATMDHFARVGIHVDVLSMTLQHDAIEASVKSWRMLLQRIFDGSARARRLRTAKRASVSIGAR
jgi:transaldolase